MGGLIRRRADDTSARSVESAAILFTALTAFLEIRHFMNGGNVYAPGAGIGELGLQVSTGLAMAIGLERMRTRSGSIVCDLSALILVALVSVTIVAQLLLWQNPLLTGMPVGGLFFNDILLGYGLPAVLIGILARVIRDIRPKPAYVVAAGCSIAMMMIYLSLEVRTIFQGPVLNLPNDRCRGLRVFSGLAWRGRCLAVARRHRFALAAGAAGIRNGRYPHHSESVLA